MSEDLRKSLATELATNLARAIEGMTSELPELSLGAEAPDAKDLSAAWKQKFSATGGAAWLAGPDSAWTSVGQRTLRAAGIEDGDAETARGTFAEVLGQAFSMLARSLSGRTRTEWACSEGGESQARPDTTGWTPVHLRFQDGASESFFVGFDDGMVRDLGARPASAVTAPPVRPALNGTAAAVSPALEKSKTLDLLLDVELPVSVSFGRAQLPLKDVVKLTTGSIVELNRTINEPVEVIVNNCVIARGEVVVIEGNYGIRIHQVVSREERLRTLY